MKVKYGYNPEVDSDVAVTVNGEDGFLYCSNSPCDVNKAEGTVWVFDTPGFQGMTAVNAYPQSHKVYTLDELRESGADVRLKYANYAYFAARPAYARTPVQDVLEWLKRNGIS